MTTSPTAPDAPRTLDVAVLRRLGQQLDVQTWPVVLDVEGIVVPPDTSTADSAAAADVLIARSGMIADDEPSSWTRTVVDVLSRPDRELELRTYNDAGVVRQCVARRGGVHVLASRVADTIDIRIVDVADTGALAAVVCSRFVDQKPCPVRGFSYPSAALIDRLGRCAAGVETTDALYAMGASAADATLISAALRGCRARTEIVAVAHDDGSLTQSSGAVAIFDTDRGRLIAGPGKALDGQVWTTLSPGSGHRIGQAVALLVETLPDGRWFA
ncbi:ESX secretion-associated protein EspG [Gordonia sp. ABSL1-1]|uniref:ESX secretion-associated protein EspG n=1 Tax=Gordonia sp. ABSL1-1 TaxID=3053923 RepID=UPI0025747258|nr:ESX secretion-associated protein EspG [Gordonia sp. ABSL1-1]MDL9936715.1 ESX secretion-associated protein EspG [Gordonia sp. ABSL1-1]